DVLEAVEQEPADAILIFSEPGDMSLAEFAEQLTSRSIAEQCLIVVQIPADAAPEAAGRWQRLAQEFNLETSDSLPHLVNRLAVLLNISVAKLSDPCKKMLQDLNDPSSVLAGKKVLIVDDDIRNIFALTSILERYDMVTVSAETGRDAINLLQA